MEHTEVSGDAAAVELSEGDLNQIVLKTQKFNETFQDEQFHNTYNLRTNIDSVMLGIQNQTASTNWIPLSLPEILPD